MSDRPAPRYPYYIFDLDGTLTDSSKAIGEGCVYVLDRLGMKDVPVDDIKRWIGRPLIEIWLGYAKEFGIELEIDPERELELGGQYRIGHDAHFKEGVIIYPHVIKTLDWLRSHGCRVSVATTKWEEAAIMVCDRTGLSDHLDAVCGTDRGMPVKPDPYVINRALHAINADPVQTLVVGDTTGDILSARAAGCSSCAVTYGFGDAAVLRKHQPTYVINNLRELG